MVLGNTHKKKTAGCKPHSNRAEPPARPESRKEIRGAAIIQNKMRLVTLGGTTPKSPCLPPRDSLEIVEKSQILVGATTRNKTAGRCCQLLELLLQSITAAEQLSRAKIHSGAEQGVEIRNSGVTVTTIIVLPTMVQQLKYDSYISTHVRIFIYNTTC